MNILCLIFVAILHLVSSQQECPEGYWHCENGNCILGMWICDGDDDCGDMSDELDTETGACPSCLEVHFQCNNGRCISDLCVCDGKDDCGDMSDEPQNSEECPACLADKWQCKNRRCISPYNICDGFDDCGDGSDEFDEATGTCPLCPDYTHACPLGGCIHLVNVCDDVNDCLDWSDEAEDICPCDDDDFRCPKYPSEEPSAPGACLPSWWICDPEGIWDCPDGSDEANCTVHTTQKII